MKTALRRLFYVVPVLALLGAWQVVTPLGSRTAFLLGSPSEIAAAATRLLASPIYWNDFAASASVFIVGLTLGVTLALIIGLGVWAFGQSGRVFEHYLVAFGTVPIFPIAPLLIFAFGPGFETRVFIVTVSVLAPFVLAVITSARQSEERYHELILSFQTTKIRALVNIVAPSAVIDSLPALKPCVNAALVAVFLSEWISAENGLAKFALASMSIYRIPDMWVALFTFVAFGVFASFFVDWLVTKATPWKRPAIRD
jgi:NitT/TauT family transport system permease protein